MSTDNTDEEVAVDAQLFEILVMMLTDAGYVSQHMTVAGLICVMAESRDNIVLATTAVTVRDLVLAEAVLSRALVARISEAPTGSKRWDAYVAVLTSQAAEAGQRETLFGLTYNLRHVRRLVKIGVDPTLAGVRRALRPLLPLASTGSLTSVDAYPLQMLAQRLVDDGLESATVNRAVAQFSSFSSGMLTAKGDDEDV